MARSVERLTAMKVLKTKKTGWYPDGDGLYLQISPTSTKSWVYRYKFKGKERRQGLGRYPDTSLDEARGRATDSRKLKNAGTDPIEHKRNQTAQTNLDSAKGITFRECAILYIDSHKAAWRNRKHESQWRNTLETYAYPIIGDLSIQDVDVGLILKVLEPIWTTKTETATRVRQRIENICDWAKAREYREGENPARWRGHLDKLLPKPTKVQKVKHFEALHYSEMPKFYQWLREKDFLSAKALTFTILTAARNGEARGADRSEIDLNAKSWTLPAERMKTDKPHRVPLSKEAIKVLKELEPFSNDERIFPGQGKASSISATALLKTLKEYRQNLTVHGFRSTFRDWCAERTNYPREVAEAALAHSLKDQTEAAYQRGDLFEKRAKMMEAWAKYCKTPFVKGQVLSLHKRSK